MDGSRIDDIRQVGGALLTHSKSFRACAVSDEGFGQKPPLLLLLLLLLLRLTTTTTTVIY